MELRVRQSPAELLESGWIVKSWRGKLKYAAN